MHATFLGTAASEGYPDAFCACANCEQARALGGPSLRKRSSVLINDDLLIDLGPDLMAAAQMHGVPLANLRYCLQTHEHTDHLDPSHFLSRSQFSGVRDAPHLHFYATQGAIDSALRSVRTHQPVDALITSGKSETLNLSVHAIEPFQTFAVGPYRVSSVRAAHGQAIVAVLYVIERGGRSLFYGTDTGPLPETTWAVLRAGRHRFNVVVLDHTFGLKEQASGHLNREQFLEQIARMRDEGLLADNARIFAHHLAHHSNPVHPELVAIAGQDGYEIPYDGLTVAI
ncbi:MAG: MBL fold metallo-hydrolase [Chloroflexota bacterium]|nr:MBL fold metallo-hydrolase [Chloroflexota bacterium]